MWNNYHHLADYVHISGVWKPDAAISFFFGLSMWRLVRNLTTQQVYKTMRHHEILWNYVFITRSFVSLRCAQIEIKNNNAKKYLFLVFELPRCQMVHTATTRQLLHPAYIVVQRIWTKTVLKPWTSKNNTSLEYKRGGRGWFTLSFTWEEHVYLQYCAQQDVHKSPGRLWHLILQFLYDFFNLLINYSKLSWISDISSLMNAYIC